ncbi:MAG: sirohydrochlorin chelatase [Cyanobacteria bacterium J06642_2]
MIAHALPQVESTLTDAVKGDRSLPILLIGHGSRSAAGRQAIFDLAEAYRHVGPERPVIPCFLELTTPTIADGVAECIRQGFMDVVVLPVLLFGARHNKFDVTRALDTMQQRYPQVTFRYGAPIGITSEILAHLRAQLVGAETHLSSTIARAETAILFVGRGSSDPEANGEACKLARMVWEGSGYQAMDVCFIGITHPRLNVGLQRSLLLQPKRILILPYLLFAGVLLDKTRDIVREYAREHPEVEISCLPNLGIAPAILQALRTREREAIAGTIQMNCHLCKFRLAASEHSVPGHHHHGSNGHAHHHHDGETDVAPDPMAIAAAYHQRAWQIP